MVDGDLFERRIRSALSPFGLLAKRIRDLGRPGILRRDILSEDFRRDIGLADGRPTVRGARRAAGADRRR